MPICGDPAGGWVPRLLGHSLRRTWSTPHSAPGTHPKDGCAALHLDLFEQPADNGFFSNLLGEEKPDYVAGASHIPGM
jgi:hypothetical protein